MQVLAFDRQEHIRRARCCRSARRSERRFDAPEAEIEPGPRIERADRSEPVEIVNGALEPDRGRMQSADRGERSVPTFECQHCDVGIGFVEHCHVNRAPVGHCFGHVKLFAPCKAMNL